jgi:Tfp pilus assembly protein PilX
MAAPQLIAKASRGLGRVSAAFRNQHGIALPTTMIMLMIVTTGGTVAIKQSMTSDDQSRLDRNVKHAIDAADAGYDTAIYRINKMQPKSGECVIVNGSGQLVNNSNSADGNGWCPEQTENLGDGVSYRYRMSVATSLSQNGQNLLQRKIVSWGDVTFGNRTVERRTYNLIAANTGNPLVGNFAIISQSKTAGLPLDNNTTVNGDIGTNGAVRLNGSARVCGDVYYGKDVPSSEGYSHAPTAHANSGCLPPYDGYNNNGGTDTATATPQPFVLDPVDQGCVRTTCNDNATLTGNPAWNAGTRTLTVSSGNVALTGNNYSFCKLVINGGTLSIPARLPGATPLRIYIDTPETCGGERSPFSLANYSTISNLNADPSAFILFVTGSPNISTTVDFNNNTSTQAAMVTYAPYSTCRLRNHTAIRGAVACNVVTVENYASITWDPLVGALTQTDILPLYRRYSYVECDKIANPSPYNQGCS